MRILMVMAGFFPGKKYGGPPVSVDNFCSLMNEHDCYIVTKNHDKGSSQVYVGIDSNTWQKKDNCLVQYLSDEDYRGATFACIVDEVKPDVIYLQGLFQSCVLPCLLIAKKREIKVLLAPRGELCAGAFRKKYKKVPYILYLRMFGLLNNVIFQSTSDEETEAIQHWLSVQKNRIHQISNVPSIPKCAYPVEKKETGRAKFVFLSRIVEKKNLLVALSALTNIRGNVELDIYGPIEDEKYWESCQHIIVDMPENVKVNYCGLVTHDDVHKIFSLYDAFVFPTQSENFGHVIAEALSVGTYAIISDQTPFSDLETYSAGKALSLSQPNEFAAAIQEVVDWDEKQAYLQRDNAKKYFKEKLNLQQLKDQYSKIFCCAGAKNEEN